MTAEINEKIVKFMIGILSTGLIGVFSWAWNLNSHIAVLEANQLNDRSNKETANEILKEWSSVRSTIISHDNQLKDVWRIINVAQEKENIAVQRLTRLEADVNNCCY